MTEPALRREPTASAVAAVPGIECFDVALPHGIQLACRAAGTQGPRIVFLHGFPEAAFVWDELMRALAGEARCLAPNLRGYAGSSAPGEVSAYRAKHLVADVLALMQATGEGPIDLLVAHDWGGAIAWNLCAQFPQAVRRLVMLNSPHPATFLRELRDNPAQQAASAYMNFLRRPDAATLLSQDDYARLWPFLHNPSEARWLGPMVQAQYRQAWGQGLAGPVAWYAASPLHPPTSAEDAIHGLRFEDAAVTVPQPMSLVWGERDIALLPCLLDGLERWVPQMRLRRVPTASHWVVHEEPQLVLSVLREHLAQL
jgi:epoxide hydrolase 4